MIIELKKKEKIKTDQSIIESLTSSHFTGQTKLNSDLKWSSHVFHLYPGAVINEQLMRWHCEQFHEQRDIIDEFS